MYCDLPLCFSSVSFPCFASRLQQHLSEKEAELQEASHVDKKGLAEAQRLKDQFASTEAANAELQKEVRRAVLEQDIRTCTYMYVKQHASHPSPF